MKSILYLYKPYSGLQQNYFCVLKNAQECTSMHTDFQNFSALGPHPEKTKQILLIFYQHPLPEDGKELM